MLQVCIAILVSWKLCTTTAYSVNFQITQTELRVIIILILHYSKDANTRSAHYIWMLHSNYFMQQQAWE